MGTVVYTFCFIIICIVFGENIGMAIAIIGGLVVAGFVIDTAGKRKMTRHMRTFNSTVKEAALMLSKLNAEVPDYPTLCRMRDNMQGIDLDGVKRNILSQNMEISTDKTGYLQTVRDNFEEILSGIRTGHGYVILSGKTLFYENSMTAIVQSRGEDVEKYVAITREIGSLVEAKTNGILSWRKEMGQRERK
ncbi:MAG: hypothetical protein LUC44_02330 [Prevotellaceae bacterium]|nr:hypothetical protein [Prevotellaceae bacterium]